MSNYIYKNGNSFIVIDSNDGTKTRFTKDDEFNLEFPESLDVCATTVCVGANCPFCYANCGSHGKHADIMGLKFIDTLRPFTEAAIQFNDLTHPDMIPFLEKLKSKKVFASITVNQVHFEQKESLIRELVTKDLIKGIGISLRKATPEFVRRVSKYPNAVIHTINGILTAEDLEVMRDHGLKLLILGYKDLGRGVGYKENFQKEIELRQRYLYGILETLPHHFRVVSFDNLAIEQLDVRRLLEPEEWDKFYMGDEGTASMFVDLVTGKFGVSSLCSPDQMHPLMDDIKDMFRVVREDVK